MWSVPLLQTYTSDCYMARDGLKNLCQKDSWYIQIGLVLTLHQPHYVQLWTQPGDAPFTKNQEPRAFATYSKNPLYTSFVL